MRKKTKIILTGLLLAVATFCFIFYQTFYAPHRDIASEKVALTMTAAALQLAYEEDDVEANKKYADKVLAVNGVATSVEPNTIVLDQTVQIDFLNEIEGVINQGDVLSIKGRCVGYDDLLEVVKIDQAIILTK